MRLLAQMTKTLTIEHNATLFSVYIRVDRSVVFYDRVARGKLYQVAKYSHVVGL